MNAGKCRPEKFRIRTLFTQWQFYIKAPVTVQDTENSIKTELRYKCFLDILTTIKFSGAGFRLTQWNHKQLIRIQGSLIKCVS